MDKLDIILSLVEKTKHTKFYTFRAKVLKLWKEVSNQQWSHEQDSILLKTYFSNCDQRAIEYIIKNLYYFSMQDIENEIKQIEKQSNTNFIYPDSIEPFIELRYTTHSLGEIEKELRSILTDRQFSCSYREIATCFCEKYYDLDRNNAFVDKMLSIAFESGASLSEIKEKIEELMPLYDLYKNKE